MKPNLFRALTGQAFLCLKIKTKGRPPNETQYINHNRISTNNFPVKVRKYLAGIFYAKFAEYHKITKEKVKLSVSNNANIFRRFYF